MKRYRIVIFVALAAVLLATLGCRSAQPPPREEVAAFSPVTAIATQTPLPPTLTATSSPPATATATSTATPRPAATATATAEPADPFDGYFLGLAEGDQGSSAPMALDLEQTDQMVTGQVLLEEGLVVDVSGLFCPGPQPVPAATLDLTYELDPLRPRHFESEETIIISGFDIRIVVIGDLAPDEETIQAEILIETPVTCANPLVAATLKREGP